MLSTGKRNRRTIHALLLLSWWCVYASASSEIAKAQLHLHHPPKVLPFQLAGQVKGAPDEYPLARAFSAPNGKWLITETDGKLQIWDTTTLNAVTPPLVQEKLLECYRLSADKKTLFTAGDKEVRFWDTNHSKLRYAKQVAKETSIANCDGSPDGARFATVLLNEVDVLVGWQIVGADAKIVFQRRFPGPIVSVEYDPTGRWIVIRIGWGAFEVLDAGTGKNTCAPIEADRDYNPNSTAPFQAQFDPTGKPRLLIPGNSGYEIVDPSNGRVRSKAHWHARPVDMMRFSADGSLVAVTTWGQRLATHGAALIVECRTGRVLRQFGNGIDDCQVGPGGKWALVNLDGPPPRTEVWDLTTGVKVQEFPRATNGISLYAAMSPTGSVIAAESSYGITTIWRLTDH